MSYSSNAVASLEQTVSGFKSRVDVKINAINTSTDQIRTTTERIFESVERFRTEMLHGEEKQIAHENILRIDQIIKERFNNYAAIRRTVIGIVRDFDINLVRNSTMQELSEELWITSSRYWLSYAVIAITAWVNDYPELAKNALAECLRRDAIKSTLFFCLMNLRFNRIEAAKKWFTEYLRTLNPAILQQETAVLLQSFLNGIFGKDKELEHEVISLIDSWITQINEDEQIYNELVDAYEKYIENINAPGSFSYETLLSCCENVEDMKKSLADASKYQTLLDFVKSLDVESEPQNDTNYKSRVDAILTTLISNYDSEELNLKNQQAYFRLIVENNGVVEKAQAQYEEMQKLQNADFNIGKQMLKWAIYDDNTQTNVHVRKFAFQNTKAWFKGAVAKWSARIQQAFPLDYRLKIAEWSGVSNGDDQNEQMESMRQFFDSNGFQLKYVNTFNITAALLFVVSAGLAFVTPYSLVITGLAAAFLAYRVYRATKEYPGRVDDALGKLEACMAELAAFRCEHEEKMQLKDKLLSEVEYL